MYCHPFRNFNFLIYFPYKKLIWNPVSHGESTSWNLISLIFFFKNRKKNPTGRMKNVKVHRRTRRCPMYCVKYLIRCRWASFCNRPHIFVCIFFVPLEFKWGSNLRVHSRKWVNLANSKEPASISSANFTNEAMTRYPLNISSFGQCFFSLRKIVALWLMHYYRSFSPFVENKHVWDYVIIRVMCERW